MRLAVTRPEQDAGTLAARLRDLGHEPVMAPLLAIRFRELVEIPDHDWGAVLVTSANGVRGLVACGAAAGLKRMTVLAVGQASAEAARAAGFGSVHSADGDLEALRDLVREKIAPGGAPLLYATGSTVSGDLKGLLEADGYTVERVVLYAAEPVTALPQELAAWMRSGDLDGVLLFSPRTARIWIGLVSAADLGAEAGRIVHYCLSPAVARGLEELGPVRCRVAAHPDTASLVAEIASD